MIAPIIAALSPLVGDLIDRAFPDSEAREQKRLEYAQKMQETLNAIDLAQIEVNKAEAAHASVFVAGWRPFLGWTCAAAFAYHFIIQPFLAFILLNCGVQVQLPAFEMETLTTVLMGLLGLGGLRTIEKVKGVTTGMAPPLPWAKKG